VVLNYNAKASFRYSLSSLEYSELALRSISMWDDTVFVARVDPTAYVVVGSGSKNTLCAEDSEPG
jgi:hypothetical protein